MQKNILILGVLVSMVLAGAGYWVLSHTSAQSVPASNENEEAIRAMVTEFGSRFKNVSLLAPDASSTIEAQYSGFVSPELLAAWQASTTQAPGRLTSSPWPERIEIISVAPRASGKAFESYQVEGNVIEITSADTPMEPAAVQPVSMTVEKQEGGWVVTAFAKGAYSELPKRITVTGVWECLPHVGDGPHTMECAFGIKKDGTNEHYAIDTRLMSQYPVDYATGAHVRVEGVFTPVEQLSSIQKYDIVGIISATSITEATR